MSHTKNTLYECVPMNWCDEMRIYKVNDKDRFFFRCPLCTCCCTKNNFVRLISLIWWSRSRIGDTYSLTVVRFEGRKRNWHTIIRFLWAPNRPYSALIHTILLLLCIRMSDKPHEIWEMTGVQIIMYRLKYLFIFFVPAIVHGFVLFFFCLNKSVT